MVGSNVRHFPQKIRFLVLIILVSLMSCTTVEKSNKNFENLANNYINALMEISPEFATYLGNHDNDHKLNDYSKDGFEQEEEYNG